jgi:hypothetical protein
MAERWNEVPLNEIGPSSSCLSLSALSSEAVTFLSNAVWQ